MKRKNRYSGILRPHLLGTGQATQTVLVLYDVEDDRIRGRVAEACLDYGLERIQYSAFEGKLNRNGKEALTLRLCNEIGETPARVRVIPLCKADCEGTWIFDQYPTCTGSSVEKSVHLRIVGPQD